MKFTYVGNYSKHNLIKLFKLKWFNFFQQCDVFFWNDIMPNTVARKITENWYFPKPLGSIDELFEQETANNSSKTPTANSCFKWLPARLVLSSSDFSTTSGSFWGNFLMQSAVIDTREKLNPYYCISRKKYKTWLHSEFSAQNGKCRIKIQTA